MESIKISILTLATFAAILPAPAVSLWTPFIIGGEVVERNELPYQVSVRRDGKHICGGAVISADTVVTAAHCVEIGSLNSFTIVAGEYSLNNDDGTEQQAKVSKIIIYDSYDPWTLANDIALMKLPVRLNFTQAVQPVMLASAGTQSNGTAIVSGWGDEGDEDERILSDVLRKVEVSIVSDEKCLETYPQLIRKEMMCAGSPEGGKDACRGDAGDPLVCHDTGSPYLCGIFSWGYSFCGEPNFPGVYSEVQYFTEWITARI